MNKKVAIVKFVGSGKTFVYPVLVESKCGTHVILSEGPGASVIVRRDPSHVSPCWRLAGAAVEMEIKDEV